MRLSGILLSIALVALASPFLECKAAALPPLLSIEQRNEMDSAADLQGMGYLPREVLSGRDTEELEARLKNVMKKFSGKSSSGKGKAGGAPKQRWFHSEGDNLSKYRVAKNRLDTKKCMAWYSEAACNSF